AIALALAQGGGSVVVNTRANQAEADMVAGEVEAAGGKALAVTADVADPDAVDSMVAATMKRFGRIDALINNAALRREKPVGEMSYAEWREVMSVTLDGPFHCVKACMPHLAASGAGTIINLGGMSGHTGSRNRLHVVTAKSGLVGFTKGLAQDLSDKAITVNL